MAGGAGWGRLARGLLDVAVRAARSSGRTTSAPAPARRRPAPRPPAPATAGAYPGDFEGTAHLEYAPHPDGDADPGEVVWGWVPYEEDPTRGKDRPALVVARDGRWVLALMLTSKDHVDGAARDRSGGSGRSGGPQWVDLGTGDWDRSGRPSEVRLDRVLRLDPDGIRREGAVLDRRRFDAVAARLRELHGWT